ncbi:hypothetical protein Glove_120g154 [Diversispora epigaea]|uniref:Uncharacterized protein n=1 Tax=Diversispora epigaea TaxID=1348612 RepID=A0A397J954_9GLOM|nr:hypothetical protein Glove_120g154 [Diversispora epigaea]
MTDITSLFLMIEKHTDDLTVCEPSPCLHNSIQLPKEMYHLLLSNWCAHMIKPPVQTTSFDLVAVLRIASRSSNLAIMKAKVYYIDFINAGLNDPCPYPPN